MTKQDEMSYLILLGLSGNLGLRSYFSEYQNVFLMSTLLNLIVLNFFSYLTFISNIYYSEYVYNKWIHMCLDCLLKIHLIS